MTRRTVVFLSFFLGIGWGTSYRVSFIFVSLLIIASLIFWLAHKFVYKGQSRLLLPVALFCFIFAISLARGTRSLGGAEKPLDQFVDKSEKIELTGVIADEPDERETSTRLTFLPDNLDERIILSTNKYPTHFYGERLKVIGQLEKPENFETEAGREFDYVNYLSKDEIYYLINQPEIESLGPSESWLTQTRAQLFRFKNFFLSRLSASLPEPHASLLGGIVIGSKRGLNSEWQERFRAVGLSHMIVLSGYNITIVAEAVAKLLAFLPIIWGLGAGGVAIVAFTLATGASSTAVRAALMALVALLGRATGRVYRSLDALVLAAFFMILIKPKILLFDLSFQLSFLATLGVIVGPPLLQKYLKYEMLTTTLAAQLVVLPWILYKMGNLSLVALPINLLVLAFVPLTMLAGFLTFLFSPFSYFAYLFLAYDLWLVQIFAALPFASLNIPYFPLWLVISIYLLYFYFWRYNSRNGEVVAEK